jgi:hypothetical protein
MRVYCIKTKYNKNDRYGLNESVDYVLFKKGYFYECTTNGLGIVVMNRDGLKFAFDSNHFATEEDWRESRLKDLGI